MRLPRLLTNRRFSSACIVWLSLWFGIVVPGHERGQIVLPGYQPPSHCGADAGEPPPRAARSDCCPAPGNDDSKRPGGPVERCAICYIVATLTVPLPIDLAPRPTARAGLVAQHRPDRPTTSPPTPPYLGRAPPA